MLIYIRQFTSAVYCGMLLSKSWVFDQYIYFYSSGDLMPVCRQSGQWQQISTYGRRGALIMKNIKQAKTVIISIIMVIIAYGIMQYMGITCPIKYITGISCAGCGMTRAWIALLHFDINTAFMYHPLFFLPPVALIIFLLRKQLNKKLYYTLFAIILAAFIIVYIYRLFNCHDGIVVFEPQNNIIHRIYVKIAIKKQPVLFN